MAWLTGIASFLTALLQAIPILNKWFTKTQEEKLRRDRERIEGDVQDETERKRPGRIF